MEMPTPGDAHRRLEVLVGTWIGEETMHPSPWDPQGGVADGTIENRLALDGFNVIQEYTQSRDGQQTFAGHGVFGWDGQRGCYTLHWFDTMGTPRTGVTITRPHRQLHPRQPSAARCPCTAQ